MREAAPIPPAADGQGDRSKVWKRSLFGEVIVPNPNAPHVKIVYQQVNKWPHF